MSKEKGCDASNFYDEEQQNNECFSDDEKENKYKNKFASSNKDNKDITQENNH